MNVKKILLAVFITITSSAVVGLSLYGYEQYIRVLPNGTYLQNISLSGLNRLEAMAELQHYIQQLNERTFVVILNDEAVSKEFTSNEVGIYFDAQKTISDVFLHTGWFASASSRDENANIYKPAVAYDEQKMEEAIRTFIFSPEKNFQNAEIVWEEKKWFIKQEASGLAVKEGEYERLSSELKKNSETLSTPEPFRVAYETVEPPMKTAQMEPLLKVIQDKLSKTVSLMVEGEKREVSFLDHSEWITLDPLGGTISFQEAFAKEWVDNVAKEWDRAPGDVVVTGIEEHFSEYDKKPIKKAVVTGDFGRGRMINREKILSSLRDFVNDPLIDRKIIVEWETINPSVTSQVAGYSFPQILSTGISSFRYGNHPNRVKNIKLSLQSFQGVVIEPGEELSFNRVTGWITPNKGYTKTQVIMEGRVEEGVGGGVCQTSTTMYRAILNAGGKVTERRNHTLDIVYYHDYGYGLDATVYTDSRSDLKFVNNFPGPILVNTYTDDFKKEAYVEFYGATDHRVVVLDQIDTGDYLLKKWNWKIIWPGRVEEQLIQSRYQLPKEEEKTKPVNPLEA